jgi:hypothetical protein
MPPHLRPGEDCGRSEPSAPIARQATRSHRSIRRSHGRRGCRDPPRGRISAPRPFAYVTSDHPGGGCGRALPCGPAVIRPARLQASRMSQLAASGKGSAQEDGCEGGLARCTICSRALTSAMPTLVTERGRLVSADVQGSMSGFGCPLFTCSELRFVRFGWPPRGSAVAVLQAGVSNARGAGGATSHEERRPSRPSKLHLNNSGPSSRASEWVCDGRPRDRTGAWCAANASLRRRV